jgi:hypothetical protein
MFPVPASVPVSVPDRCRSPFTCSGTGRGTGTGTDEPGIRGKEEDGLYG